MLCPDLVVDPEVGGEPNAGPGKSEDARILRFVDSLAAEMDAKIHAQHCIHWPANSRPY